MPETQPKKGGNGMWEVRVPAIILAAGLTIGPSLQAQVAPQINLPAGDAVRGKAIFEGKGNCQNCHRVNGAGSLFGPDLSTIGAPPGRGGGGAGRGGAAPAPAAAPVAGAAAANPAPEVPPVPAAEPPRGGGGGNRGGQPGQGGAGAPTPQQLAQSIIDPTASMAVQNRYVALKMKDGKTITGKLLSIDTFNLQIFDPAEKLTNISRDNVREMTMTSPMPSYREKLNSQELSDVVTYLTSLKGQ